MFRTFCASLSVSGISFAKSLFILSASEETGRRDGPEIWVDPIDKLSMATILDEDLEAEFMAEPLTDRVTEIQMTAPNQALPNPSNH